MSPVKTFKKSIKPKTIEEKKERLDDLFRCSSNSMPDCDRKFLEIEIKLLEEEIRLKKLTDEKLREEIIENFEEYTLPEGIDPSQLDDPHFFLTDYRPISYPNIHESKREITPAELVMKVHLQNQLPVKDDFEEYLTEAKLNNKHRTVEEYPK